MALVEASDGPAFVGPRLEGEEPPEAADFASQALRMPAPVRRLLLEGAGEAVSPAELIEALRLPEEARRAAERGAASASEEAMLVRPGALSDEACAALCGAVDRRQQRRPDSVDGLPDCQLNVTRPELEALIGREETEALYRLPAEFLRATARQDSCACADAEVFVRRYAVDSRPWNPFHTDSAALTVNVALVDDASFEGGRLLACCDGRVRELERRRGEATVHASTLLHAVAALRSGVRYSLIMFFGQPEDKAEQFDEGARGAEAAALRRLMGSEDFLPRCAQVLGAEHAEAMRRGFASLEGDLGLAVERVVAAYGAPHLRPTHIASRHALCQDSSCWSAYNLLKYAAHASLARAADA